MDPSGSDRMESFSKEMFNGRAVEQHLKYHADKNSYRLDA